MENNIHILHLEDQEVDSILIKSYISKGFSSFDYYFAEDEQEFIRILETEHVNIILSDYQLPGYSGAEALRYVKTNYPHIPFIFVTGKMGEDAAIESLLDGATDYVMKSKPERLVPAISRVLFEADLRQEKINSDIALRDSEERYRGLLRNLDAGVMVYAPDSSIILSNPKAAELLGLKEDEIIGKPANDPCWNFLYEDSSVLPAVCYPAIQILTTGRPIRDFRMGVSRPAGHDIVWLTVNGSPVFDDHGGITEVVISFLDITGQKKFEEELQRAKEKAEASDRLKTAFIGNISHEILTPLNGILGFGELMTDPDLSRKEKEDFLKMLNESSARLVNTVNNIMDISLIVSGNQEVRRISVVPVRLLAEIYEKFIKPCTDKKLEFSILQNSADQEVSVLTDPELLRKVLIHLLENAVKFTKEGIIEAGFMVNDHEIEFYVKDTGIGISVDKQKNIFDLFIQEDHSNTRKHDGNGLGLSIARGVVELLGGRIRVESVKGKGSSFFFTIPRE